MDPQIIFDAVLALAASGGLGYATFLHTRVRRLVPRKPAPAPAEPAPLPEFGPSIAGPILRALRPKPPCECGVPGKRCRLH